MQALYDRVIGWYEDAERKAQLILTLNGVFLSFLAASTFTKASDLHATTSRFGAETWTLLALMAVSLACSVVSAVVALRSRLYSPDALERHFGKQGVDRERAATYRPAVTWFFQHLSHLDPACLAQVLSQADATFAVESLAFNVVPLATNVVAKHRWVNRGFFFFGAVLVFFLAAVVSYALRVASA